MTFDMLQGRCELIAAQVFAAYQEAYKNAVKMRYPIETPLMKESWDMLCKKLQHIIDELYIADCYIKDQADKEAMRLRGERPADKRWIETAREAERRIQEEGEKDV